MKVIRGAEKWCLGSLWGPYPDGLDLAAQRAVSATFVGSGMIRKLGVLILAD
jgi:hypothetical protein